MRNLLALNWKMNKTPSEARSWAAELGERFEEGNAELAVMAPAVSATRMRSLSSMSGERSAERWGIEVFPGRNRRWSWSASWRESRAGPHRDGSLSERLAPCCRRGDRGPCPCLARGPGNANERRLRTARWTWREALQKRAYVPCLVESAWTRPA